MIAVVDYGMGNLGNVCRAIKHCGGRPKICATSAPLRKAEKIVLPGVGAFPDAVKGLKRKRLWKTLLEEVKKGKPLMGVCLGYQLLFSSSDENGKSVKGLDLIPGKVRRFPARISRKKGIKIPHMGWNELEFKKKSALLKGVKNKSYFYFVHSYYPEPKCKKDVLGSARHGRQFAAAVERGKVSGFQFHPEKSQEAGLKILRNFIKL